jgi:hypothetical protein
MHDYPNVWTPGDYKTKEFDLTVNKVDGTYAFTFPNSMQNLLFGPQNIDPNPPIETPTYQAAYGLPYPFSGTYYYFRIGYGKDINGSTLQFSKYIHLSANDKFTHFWDNFCFTGIGTKYGDIADPLVFDENHTAIVDGAALVSNRNFNINIIGGAVRLSVGKGTNQVVLDATLIGEANSAVTITLKGVGTIDPATGRFSGTLQGPDEDAQSVFEGSLFGPTGAEFGLALKGRWNHGAYGNQPYVATVMGKL